MAIITYLDANCLIAIADAEPQRRGKVLALLSDTRRSFIYSPFTTLETLTRSGQPSIAVLRAANAVEDLWEDLRP